jgi:hypothetical protein
VTQILPRTDAFDDGSPSFGTRPLAWLGLEPVAATYGYGNLHDGYGKFVGLGGFQRVNAVAFPTSGDADTVPRGFVHRIAQAENVYVSAGFYSAAFLGAALPAYITEFGVAVRVQGGTLNGGGTTDVRLTDVSCYLARLRGVLATNQTTWSVVRVNAGVETVLGTTTISAAQSSVLQFARPFTLRLRLNTLASGVEYVFEALGLDATAGFTLAPTAFVQGIDTSGSRLTGTGRVGFTMGVPRSVTTPTVSRTVPICEFVEVRDWTVPTKVTFRDEFRRYAATVAKTIGPDSNAVSGKSVQEAWTLGQFTSGTPFWTQSSNRITRTQVSPGKEARAAISTLAASDDKHQRRRCKFNIATGTSTEVAVGVICRAATTGTGDFGTGVFGLKDVVGYVAYCHYVTAGTVWNVGIRLYNGAILGGFKIAEKSQATQLFPVNGTDFTIDLEIAPQGPDPLTAPVEMKVRVDGTQVVLVAQPLTGISADALGTVTDAGNGRLQANFGEGFFAGGFDSNRVIQMDDWTQMAVPSLDLASIIVPTEGSAVDSIDPILRPDFGIEVEEVTPRIEIPFESGHVYVAPVFEDADGDLGTYRRWRATANAIDVLTHRKLEDFFDRHRGREVPFFFTDESGVQRTVVFAGFQLGRSKRGPDTSSAELAFEEVISS